MKLKSYEDFEDTRVLDIEKYIRELPWTKAISGETRTLVAVSLRTLYRKLPVEVCDQLPKFYVWQRGNSRDQGGMTVFRVESDLYSPNIGDAVKYSAAQAATLRADHRYLAATLVDRVELLRHWVVPYGLMELEVSHDPETEPEPDPGAGFEPEPPPVDTTQQREISGSGVEGPVTENHRGLKENGQQRGYVILSQEERDKGFVRPVRRRYLHSKCGVITTISSAIAETYARYPGFYSGTFCSWCRDHLPVDQFVWNDGEGTVVGS